MKLLMTESHEIEARRKQVTTLEENGKRALLQASQKVQESLARKNYANVEISQAAAEEMSLSKELNSLLQREHNANAVARSGIAALEKARELEQSVKLQSEGIKEEQTQ